MSPCDTVDVLLPLFEKLAVKPHRKERSHLASLPASLPSFIATLRPRL